MTTAPNGVFGSWQCISVVFSRWTDPGAESLTENRFRAVNLQLLCNLNFILKKKPKNKTSRT